MGTSTSGKIGTPPRGNSLPIRDWLETAYLSRAARRVAFLYDLSEADTADLNQELCLALCRRGLGAQVNVTWIFHTAIHKAVDILRRRRSAAELASGSARTEGRQHPELIHLLRAKVDGLPAGLREFYKLRFQLGLSQREAAQKLGLMRGTVRSLDQKCLSRIGIRKRA